MVKICAISCGIADCQDSCPQFERRIPPKHRKVKIEKHRPHVPFYKGKKEVGHNGKPKSCRPAKDHPWRRRFKRRVNMDIVYRSC